MNQRKFSLSIAFCVIIVFSNILGAIQTEVGINEGLFVKSGETELYLKVRGNDTSNPVLLYLH